MIDVSTRWNSICNSRWPSFFMLVQQCMLMFAFYIPDCTLLVFGHKRKSHTFNSFHSNAPCKIKDCSSRCYPSLCGCSNLCRCLTRLPSGLRLGSWGITKHHQRLIRTFGNEIVALRQFAESDGIKLIPYVCASILFKRDTKVSCIRCSYIWGTAIPRIWRHSIFVKLFLILFQVIYLTCFKTRWIWISYITDDGLFVTHFISNRNRQIIQWYSIGYNFWRCILIHIGLVTTYFKSIRFIHLENWVIKAIINWTIGFFFPNVIDVNAISRSYLITKYITFAKCSFWIITLPYIERWYSIVSKNLLCIITVVFTACNATVFSNFNRIIQRLCYGSQIYLWEWSEFDIRITINLDTLRNILKWWQLSREFTSKWVSANVNVLRLIANTCPCIAIYGSSVTLEWTIHSCRSNMVILAIEREWLIIEFKSDGGNTDIVLRCTKADGQCVVAFATTYSAHKVD